MSLVVTYRSLGRVVDLIIVLLVIRDLFMMKHKLSTQVLMKV